MKYIVEFDEDEDVELRQYAEVAQSSPEDFVRKLVVARVKPEKVIHAPILNASSGANE